MGWWCGRLVGWLLGMPSFHAFIVCTKYAVIFQAKGVFLYLIL